MLTINHSPPIKKYGEGYGRPLELGLQFSSTQNFKKEKGVIFLSISEQLEREKKIKQEINRIKKLYKDLEKDKVKVVEGLITEASFMKLTLQELREDLFKNGMTELYENGPQVVNRERPETKIYSTMIQRYSNVMKQLIDYMPEEEQKEENDELKEFLNRRKVK